MESSYVIGEVIGAGQFSQVYKGYHKTRPEHALAIKVLDLKGLVNKHGVLYHKYLKREVDMMTALKDNNNIVCLDGIETIGDFVYIAMEYCDSDLKSYLTDPKTKQERHLTEQEAQNFMRQLANGLKSLCDQAIAHRDLKPQNILLAVRDGHTILKIADFGFARVMPNSVDMKATVLGTPMYMAPEVAKKNLYSDTCDLWSVGMIFYEMMFGGVNLYKNLKKLQDIPDHIDFILNQFTFSDECKGLFRKLLQIDPKKRISWIDFFSHTFLREPHPELSILSPPEEPNTIQVFGFPSLEIYHLLFEPKDSVLEWKIASGLDEQHVVVLCRNTESNKVNEVAKWCGIEMRDIEPMEHYQITELGSPNRCIFLFGDDGNTTAKSLLGNLGEPPKIKDPTHLKIDMFLEQCYNSVSELYSDIEEVYVKCTKFVCTRELILYGNRALSIVNRSKRLDLEGEYSRLQTQLKEATTTWHRVCGLFDATCATIDSLAAVALPAFLKPSKEVLEGYIGAKRKHLESAREYAIKIDASFAKAQVIMNSWTSSSVSLGTLKDFLNGDIYEHKKNVECFKSMLANKSKVAFQQEDDSDEKKGAQLLLDYSKLLNFRVRQFYTTCQNSANDTDMLINQTRDSINHYRQLSKLSESNPDMEESASIPNVARDIQTFASLLDPLLQFINLPGVIDGFLSLLHERQAYEVQMLKIVPKTDALLKRLFNRHVGHLDKLYLKNKSQIDTLFPRFSQLSPLPTPSASLSPAPALEGYPEIPASFLPPSSPLPKKEIREVEMESEFSFIMSETTSMADLVRDNAQLSEKLRTANEALDQAQGKVKAAEARAGIGAGDLARRVALYDRLASLRNSMDKPKHDNVAAKNSVENAVQIRTSGIHEIELREQLRKELYAQIRSEVEAETRTKRDEEHRAAQDTVQEMAITLDVQTRELKEQKELLERTEAVRARLASEQIQAGERNRSLETEIASCKRQLVELNKQSSDDKSALDQLTQKMEEQSTRDKEHIATLQAQLVKAHETQQQAEENNNALSAQIALQRDTIMAYELSFAMAAEQQQQGQPAGQ